MNRRILTSALAAFALLIGAALAVAQQFGTTAEAKAMLEKAVAALKANEADGSPNLTARPAVFATAISTCSAST